MIKINIQINNFEKKIELLNVGGRKWKINMNEKLKFLSNKICGSLSVEETIELLKEIKQNSKNSNLNKLVDEIHTKLESQIYNKNKLEKTTFTMSFEKDLVSPPEVDKEPSWFKKFRIQNDKRWEEQCEFNKKINSRLDTIDNRLDNLVKVNNLKE